MVGRQAPITRVSPETKRRVSEVSARQLVKPSVWLRRVVADALGSEPSADAGVAPIERSIERPTHRLSVRIRPADAALLKPEQPNAGCSLQPTSPC